MKSTMLFLLLLLALNKPSAQYWYLDVRTGQLHRFSESGDRFAASALLAVAVGAAEDVAEQLPHALDAYGIDYDYHEAGLVVYTGPAYQAWRLMQAGEDVRAALGTLLLAQVFSQSQSAQWRVVGNWLWRGRNVEAGRADENLSIWELPAVRRGVEIEIRRAGGDRLPNGFPVVDIMRNGTAISVKSIDITLPSYHGIGLFHRLKNFVDRLSKFRGADWQGYPVSGSVKKELEVIIPAGKATSVQKRIFEEIIQYGRSRNIPVKFIEL